jgi:hypothetical protein
MTTEKSTVRLGVLYSVRQELPQEDYEKITRDYTRVGAGSNTSTVTLRVVGGDEEGSFETETLKYGHESYGTRTRK